MPATQAEQISQLPFQEHQINYELRHRTDTETWLAEVLNGSMHTSFEFSNDGEQLYGEDGGALREVFDNAIQTAQIIVSQNPSLAFELRRRLIERDELEDIEKMIKSELIDDEGNTVNTIVVTSDYPEDLIGSGEDVGGYNDKRRQAMLRIITFSGNTVRITTQSLDGSNRKGLEAVRKALGHQSEEGELLGQRINLHLPEKWQDQLADNLTNVYDNSMAEQLGGEWHAGIRQPSERSKADTYQFARKQTDLVDLFVQTKMTDPKAAEKLRYDLAATASARYERFIGRSHRDTAAGASRLHRHDRGPQAFVTELGVAVGRGLQHEMKMEGRLAQERGQTFSGCGVTLKSNFNSTEDPLTANQLNSLGYGNMMSIEVPNYNEDDQGSLDFECTNGHKNSRHRGETNDECDHAGCNGAVACKT